MKTRHYIHYGPHILTVIAERMENVRSVLFTAYVNNCSVRSHHLQNEEVRNSWVAGVWALLGGGDDDTRAELSGIIDIELKAFKGV